MDAKNKVFTHTGYHWRDQLVTELLPYVKDGVDRKSLNNLVRGYVPFFFSTTLDSRDESVTWLFTLSLGSRNSWWEKEIEDIGREFIQKSCSLDDRLVKNVFRKHGWEVDEPVIGISISDKRGRWRYDAYKDKIAVEVELSSRSQVFKDAFKFLIGQAMNQIDVGVVMVQRHLDKQGNPYLGSVGRDWHAIYTSLPMLKIAFHGFPNEVG